MAEETNQGKLKAKVVSLSTLHIHASAQPLTPWISYSFAQDWFIDALNETRSVRNHHSRRREILFAVCCAESYLFEWVRDEILNRDLDSLPKYFPIDNRRGIADRWKEVIRAIHYDGLISAIPDFGKPYWEELIRLVEYRNGLVHGISSHPDTASLKQQEKTKPSKDDLDKLESGWSVKVVINLIRHLHEALDSRAPQWLAEP